MAEPEIQIASQAEFARIARFKPGYVTQLKRDGRLVMAEDGRRVCVAESLARIEATRDPSRAAVAARHEAARSTAGAAAPAIAPPGAAGEPGGDDPTEGGGEGEGGTGYQHWRARNERAKALASERENAIAEGKLLDAAQVEAEISAAATVLRSRLESLPAILGPQLAAVTDEGQVIAILAETIEHALEEIARQFGAVGQGEKP